MSELVTAELLTAELLLQSRYCSESPDLDDGLEIFLVEGAVSGLGRAVPRHRPPPVRHQL